MANYTKLDIHFQVSDQSDYNASCNHVAQVEITTDTQYQIASVASLTTTPGETIIAADTYSSIQYLMVENLDSTNTVTVACTVNSVAVGVIVPALGVAVIPNIDADEVVSMYASADPTLVKYSVCGIAA